MSRSLAFILLAVILVVPAPSAAASDSTRYFFYRGYDYGTQANFNPGDVIINGGYGIWQVYPATRYRKIFDAPYRCWLRNNWENIRNPFLTVKRFGARRFFTTEVFPTSLSIKKTQWVPNYTLHAIGAGMLSREMEEWYRWHGFGHPRIWSVATMYAYHLLTETVENGPSPKLSVDAVADLYIFDPISIILFTSDRVCRFFSDKLELSEWSLQPAYNARTGNLENMGQFYIVRWPLVSDKRWSLLVHGGLHAMAGLSRRLPDGRSFSLTAGAVVEDLHNADQGGLGLAKAASATWSAGAFYDRNNSLLLSVTGSGYSHNRFRMNIYPGLLKTGPVSPGLFTAYTGDWVMGLSLRYLPLGTGTSGRR